MFLVSLFRTVLDILFCQNIHISKRVPSRDSLTAHLSSQHSQLTRVSAGDGVVGHGVGGDIVLALQRIRVIGNRGKRLGRIIGDHKVVTTLVTLRLLALGTKNLKSDEENILSIASFVFSP